MPVSTGALGMHDALRDPLPVKMRHLFEQQEIFEDHRPAWPHGQRILVVAHGKARIRGHDFLFLFRHESSSVAIAAAAQSEPAVIATARVEVRDLYIQYIVRIRWIGIAYGAPSTSLLLCRRGNRQLQPRRGAVSRLSAVAFAADHQ